MVKSKGLLKYPCKECIIKTSCSEFCDNLKQYYTIVAMDYYRYRNESTIFKEALKDNENNLRFLKKGIDISAYIILTNPITKKRYRISTGGKIYDISY